MKTQDTLAETNIAPANGWLEDEISFWDGPFSGAMLVSGKVILKNIITQIKRKSSSIKLTTTNERRS